MNLWLFYSMMLRKNVHQWIIGRYTNISSIEGRNRVIWSSQSMGWLSKTLMVILLKVLGDGMPPSISNNASQWSVLFTLQKNKMGNIAIVAKVVSRITKKRHHLRNLHSLLDVLGIGWIPDLFVKVKTDWSGNPRFDKDVENALKWAVKATCKHVVSGRAALMPDDVHRVREHLIGGNSMWGLQMWAMINIQIHLGIIPINTRIAGWWSSPYQIWRYIFGPIEHSRRKYRQLIHRNYGQNWKNDRGVGQVSFN